VVRGLLLGALALVFVGVSASAADDVSPITINLQTNDIVVAPDGSSVQTVHSELLAENEVGAIRLNQIHIAFNSAQQDLQIIEAYTLKPDGTKIPIDMSAVFVRLPQEESQSGEITDKRVKVVVFPQLSAGDTAVYSAKFVNKAAVIPGIFTYGRVFNPAARVKEQRDTVTAPKSMGLRTESHEVEFTSNEDGNNLVFRWHYSAPKAGAAVNVMVSPMERMPRYFVSNAKDYAGLGAAFGALLNPKIVVTPKVQELADKLTAGETNRREQVRKLYEWVNSNIRYIAIELGQGTMVPHDADAILTYGYGDCKDHDLLLRVLMKAKGIASQSVLINSANAYSLTQVPTFMQLDHVITYVPEMKLHMDSTALAMPYGVLPFGEYGKPVIYISEEGARLGTMPALQPGLASENTTNVMHLSAAGVLTGKSTTTAIGPAQTTLRYVGLALQVVSSEKIAADQLEKRGYRGGTGTLKGTPPTVRSNSYTIIGEYTIPGWSEWLSGARVSFMPIGLRILGVAGDGPMGTMSSLKAVDQATPCFSVRQTEDDSLDIPPGTRFAFLPADVRVANEFIQFTAHWTQSGNTLSVHREFRSTIDQPLCTGAVRLKAAQAVLQIAASYMQAVRIVPDNGQPALLSQNETRPLIGPNSVGESEMADDVIAVARLGDTNRAARMIDTMVAANHTDTSDSYSAHLAQGLTYLNSNHLPQAVTELSEAIRLNPEAGAEPYSARAAAYSKMSQNRLALADLDSALKASPNDAHLRQMHADALLQLHDFDGAAADYNVVVRAQPNDAAVLLKRAEIRYRADKYEEAAADYRRALRLGALETDVRSGLCNALARSEDQFAQAVDHCSKVLGHEAQSATTLESRGYAYFRQGKMNEALKDFDQAVKASPQNAPQTGRLLYERGVTAVKLGNNVGRKDIEAAIKLVPNVAKKVPVGIAP
jgi:tetratricopeptide (TPR) repeat protein